MAEHVAFLLRGLGNGGVFAALAMALVVTFRSSGVVNFATGAIALYAAETYARARTGELFVPFPGFKPLVSLGTDDVPFAAAALIALVAAAILGLLLHYLVFRPLRAAPAMAKAVASIGVMLLIQAVIAIRLGTDPIQTAAILPQDNIQVLGQSIRADLIWFAIVVIGLAMVLGVLFRFTSFGLETRASAESEKGAYVTGLSPERIARSNWALGAVVAGVAGIVISPMVPITPASYTNFITPALAAALLGGFVRLTPAVIGGLAIGMLQSELAFLQLRYDWLPGGGLPSLLPLILILVVLVIRGRPLPDRGTVVTRSVGRAPRPEHVWPATVVFAGGATVAIFLVSGGYRNALILTFIYATLALSWVVVTGYAGQVSLAQLSLAGVGAFSLFRFAENWGVPFPLSPLLAATAATVLGVVVGLPALRIRGLPVAIVTLAFASAADAFWFNNPDFNGGLGGANIETPTVFGNELRVDALSSRIPFALMSLFVLTVVAVAVAILRRSQLGASMLAVKANERSAAAAGIDVARTKVIAFAIGAFIAGLAGSMLAYYQGGAIATTYNSFAGIGLFGLVYLSGVSTISGGINTGVLAAGGLAYVVVDRNLELGEWYAALSGVLLILTIVQNPEGIMGDVQNRIGAWRNRKGALDLPSFEVRPQDVSEPAVVAGQPVLRAENITVEFGAVRAVDSVSIEIREGSIVGLIGPNGAGKTTLIDAMSGYVRTTSGSTSFSDSDISGLPAHRRARLGLGRTFQGVELYEDLTVEENIAVGLRAARGRTPDGADSAAVITQLCDLLHLDAVRHRPVAELSAGFRQLVSIARSLAGQPKVLLLDEPAGGLDPKESRWLADRLRDVRSAGATIVMIDHDMDLVLGVCDRIYVLDLGVIIAEGTPSEIQDDRRVSAAYLGAADEQAVGSAT